MEKVLIAGTAIRTEGEGGWKEVEDKEKKQKTHFGKDFDPWRLLGKGCIQE